MTKYLLTTTFIIFFIVSGYHSWDPHPIPDNLLECYRRPVQLLPMTMRTMIDIIRKIESNPFIYMDLRIQTNVILSRFWRDGIRKDPIAARMPNVVPYLGDGVQFYKYALLQKLVPYNGGPPFPDEILTVNERCTLHRMLSSGMEVWERGDEYLVCPQADPQQQVTSDLLTGAKKSSCPIELGVVKTEYGTLSPNHILLAIASSLQPQEVDQHRLLEGVPRKWNGHLYFPYNKTVDNFWAATIAGDMAELLVFQLPLSIIPKFGPSGYWNDDTLPERFYQTLDYQGVLNDFWLDTNAEVLGGIDGMMIGSQILDWNTITGSLRLSQVLEMFYSPNGGEYPNQHRACRRTEFFVGVLAKSRGIIEQQTSNFAELLTVNSVNFLMEGADVFISKNKVRAFDAYKDYVNALVSRFPACPSKLDYSEAKVRLIVLYDATWDVHTTLQVLTRLSTALDVSKYGSSITVINGVTGYEVVSYADSIGDLFLNWVMSNPSVKEVKSADLTKGFLKLKEMVESDRFRRRKSVPAADVTLVLAKNSLLTDAALSHISSSVDAIKSEIPDMRFIYVIKTTDSRPWVKLTALPHSQNDEIITMDDDNIENLHTKLEILQDVPSSICPPLCGGNNSDEKAYFSLEQYVTPGVSRNYMIHPSYLCSSSYVDIQVVSFNYGDLLICVSRSNSDLPKRHNCNSVGQFETIKFRIDNPCSSKLTSGPLESWDTNCRPIFLSVSPLKSSSRCTEKDCRFTNQVRYNLNIGGINCIKGYGITCSATWNHPSFLLSFITFVFVLIKTLNIYE